MVELWDSRDGIRAVDHCSTALYIFVYRDHLAPHAPYLALIAGKDKDAFFPNPFRHILYSQTADFQNPLQQLDFKLQ